LKANIVFGARGWERNSLARNRPQRLQGRGLKVRGGFGRGKKGLQAGGKGGGRHLKAGFKPMGGWWMGLGGAGKQFFSEKGGGTFNELRPRTGRANKMGTGKGVVNKRGRGGEGGSTKKKKTGRKRIGGPGGRGQGFLDTFWRPPSSSETEGGGRFVELGKRAC